jgi:type VI secretion system secreted protein VgrG
MEYTQDGRLIAIDTPLGKDVLLLQELTGSEAMSRLFNFRLRLLSVNRAIPFDGIVGQRVTIRINLTEGEERCVNGFVSRFAQSGSDERFTHYQAEVVPWLWFLTRTADCRIFQNKTIPEIIKQIFTDLGFQDVKDLTQGKQLTTPREYCVQYRETDFNFVSRLMEQYGIYYFFEHDAKKHTLVLVTPGYRHQPCPQQAKVRYGYERPERLGEGILTDLHMEQELRPGKYALTDYNFKTPATNLAANAASVVKVGGNQKYEVYDYPGEYLNRDQGTVLTRIRMEEEEATHVVIRGAGTCRPLVPGHRFDLVDHYRRDVNKSYVLTEVQHSAGVGESYYSLGAGAVGELYSNTFACIPDTVPYRPLRITPKPVIQGPQTAVVVGKAGEEIWPDEYGRVKVQFHWDREGKADEDTSCWIRVAQNAAGKRWGMVFIPRIGHEVIVDFEEGDPDRPIIVGSVYNAQEMPPYKLPDEKTKTILFKSNTTPGGNGFNELRIEDKSGKEQIFIHAQRNKDIRVKKDLYETIGESSHHIVAQDQLVHVKGDRHDRVNGDENKKVDGTVSLEAGMDMQEKVGMKHALDAGMEIHLKAGMNVVVESGVTLTLKVGGNFININPGGIFISGIMVMINSGGAAGSGAGSSPEAPKAPTEADRAETGQVSQPPPAKRPPKPESYSPAAVVLQRAAENATPFCEAG